MELKVKNFYNSNFKRFNDSRVRIWKAVRDFTSTLDKNSKILESGCGNGKNLQYFEKNNLNAFGIDFSKELVHICLCKDLKVIEGDVRNLPYPENFFDNVVSIAVIHHLQKESDRIKAIEEMQRVCKPDGKILISIWSVEQEEDSKRKFRYGDNMVGWVDTERYYFIYDEEHIKQFMKNFKDVSLFWEKGNWFLLIDN